MRRLIRQSSDVFSAGEGASERMMNEELVSVCEQTALDDKKSGLRFLGSRDRLGEKIPHGTQRRMVWISNDDMIEDFDFEKLPGSDEIASDFYVGFGWGRLTARMIMRDNDCGGTRHDC